MLIFLHTSNAHVATFGALAQEVDPAIPVRHVVAQEFLADALAAGAVTDVIATAVAHALQTLADEGAKVIVCTCSTIASAVESVSIPDCLVMRIDRPMAEIAVAGGRRIVVFAALRTALEPTIALLHEIASATSRSPVIVGVLCDDAWSCFVAGDMAGYGDAIVAAIMQNVVRDDLIVMAQASMACAADRIVNHSLARQGVTALSSPRSGVTAAMSAYRKGGPP